MNSRAALFIAVLLAACGVRAEGTAYASDAPAHAAFLRQQSPRQLLARDLLDKRVLNPHAEDLGHVHDVILDPEGVVKGIVVSTGGFLGLGEKRVGLPWRAVTIRNAGKFVVVNLSREQLAGAPEYRVWRGLGHERSTIHVAEPHREEPGASRP